MILGQAIGENIVVVAGNSRTPGTDRSGQRHAWNAVEINQEWHLLDTTWDSGSVDGSTFTKRYRTTYLINPAIFVVTGYLITRLIAEVVLVPGALGSGFTLFGQMQALLLPI
ncbi:MAG: hypothetical protein WCA35_18120 [Kovacikia sp.]